MHVLDIHASNQYSSTYIVWVSCIQVNMVIPPLHGWKECNENDPKLLCAIDNNYNNNYAL